MGPYHKDRGIIVSGGPMFLEYPIQAHLTKDTSPQEAEDGADLAQSREGAVNDDSFLESLLQS